MSKRGTNPAAEEPLMSAENPDANLEQIRVILFGQQMREFEHKLRGLEERTSENQGQMHTALLERLGSLESRLSDLLSQETQERQIADNSLQSSLDSAVDKLEARLASEIKDVRADLKEQGKEIDKKMDQLGNQLQAAIDELRLQKTDRVALANLLSGVAEKLRKD